MIKVIELKENKVLPQQFLDVLPSHCSVCNSELEITETLSQLKCVNPLCIEKGVQRMVVLLQDLGVKDMGESRCRAFLEHYGVTNPYSILLYEPDVDGVLFEGCSMQFSRGIVEQIDKVRSMYLYEFVMIGNLPGIRDTARKLCGGYTNLDDFYEDLYEGGVDFVQSLLGIKGTKRKSSSDSTDLETTDMIYSLLDRKTENGISVKALDIYNTLMDYEEELRTSIEGVNIKTEEVTTINICISSSVGKPYKSKADFVNRMNALCEGKVHLILLKSYSKSCEFMIWSKEGNPTSKATKAEKDGIPIMTGAEFEQYLKEEVL